jgi:hypothetical protein
VIGLLAIAGVGLATTAPAVAQAKPIDSFCEPHTGDYCLGVFSKKGRIELAIATFSFRGSYGLCVKTPKPTNRCHHFHLQHHGDIYEDRVDFGRHYPHKRSGRYTVTRHKSGHRLRKPLHFRLT